MSATAGSRMRTIAAIVAVVVLGGTSYAAVSLPRNSVKRRHIAQGAVTTFKVVNGTLRVADLNPKAVERLRGAQGPAGEPGPQGEPGPAGAPGPPGPSGAQPVSQDVESAVVTTGSPSFVPLGGPSVVVTVPASGLIEVVASVHFTVPGDDGAVGLFEDGNLVTLDNADACPGPSGTLFNTFSSSAPADATSGTPGSLTFVGCGTLGLPGPVLLRRTPGPHTYELRYAECGCAPEDANFDDRFLAVTPRP